MVGALFSIPNWLLLWVCYYFISETTWPLIRKRGLLLTASLLLTVLLFVFYIGGQEIISAGDYVTVVSYMLTVTIGCMLYKVNTVPRIVKV